MIPEEERRSLGLTEPLPGSLEEALEVLDKNKTWVESAVGEYYTDIYVALKKEEINLWQSMEVDARRLTLTTFY
jgi:glutamine synthetase